MRKMFIFAGQSNAGGYGSLAGLPLASPNAPNAVYSMPTALTLPCYYYQTNTNANLSAFKSYALQDASTYGPELTFLTKYHAAYPDQDIGAIKVTFGGSSITEWLDWGWDALSGVISQADGLLTGEEYEWAGLLWLQGETGAQDVYKQTIDTSMGDAFIQNTINFFALVRGATSATMPIVVGKIGDHMATEWYLNAQVSADPRYTTDQFLAALQRRWYQQEQVVASVARSTLVSMDGFGNRSLDSDAIHWPDNGYLGAGERFFTGYQSLTTAARHLAINCRPRIRVGAA